MIEDHYEINVSRKERKYIYDMEERYYHFCKIEIRETNEENVMEKYRIICEKFRAQEYKCTLTKVICRGELIAEN